MFIIIVNNYYSLFLVAEKDSVMFKAQLTCSL
jgi:hypothetical protein